MTEQQDTSVSNNPAATPDVLAEQLEDVARRGVTLGRLWASHGLMLGQLALEHSARTLELTAGALGSLSKAFLRTDRGPANEPVSPPR